MINYTKLATIIESSCNPDIVFKIIRLMNTNKTAGIQLLKAIDKRYLAEMINHSTCERALMFIRYIFDIDVKVGKHFWENHIDKKELIKKMESLSDIAHIYDLVEKLLCVYKNNSQAKKICGHFGKKNILSVINKTEKMYYGYKFLILLSNIDKKFGEILVSCVSTDTIKLYFNTLIREGFNKYIYCDFDIALLDVDVAKFIYSYICKEIGIFNYLKMIKGSQCDEVLQKSKDFLMLVDPRDKQKWKQYLCDKYV